MKKYFFILFIGLPFLANAQKAATVNPFLVHSNQPIHFEKIDSATVKDAVAQVIAQCDKRIKAIIAVPAGRQTVANTLMAFDDLSYDLGDLGGKVYLVTATYTDDRARNEANTQLNRLSSYGSDLYLNIDLYRALKRFSGSAAGKHLRPDQQKFLNETLISFEINGTKLDDAGRAALKTTNDKIIDFFTQFDKNIATSNDSARFTSTDLQGVPEAISASWKRADGSYVVRVNGPNYINIEKYADPENTRRVMLLKYYNRAYPANITALDSLLKYRQQFATQLGFKTYAEYALVQKMAAKPSNVWHFLDDLKDKLTPYLPTATAELRAIKHQLHPELPDTIYAWDGSYYNKKLLDTKYKLNTDEVKRYFEMNNTINGMFKVYQKLFAIDIREVKGLPVWYSKVKSYELYKDGKKMGTFYLDLYPRPNKYTHFETSNISWYHLVNGKEILPVGTLICNFPESTPSQPSLLTHSDVITMFHEFGHLINFLLCHPVISSQNAFAVKGDFVEAPSQFLENFCWDYNCLKLFARDYQTGKVMPLSLFKKMKSVQMLGVSNSNMFQVYLGMIDFTYEDKYDLVKEKGVNQISKDLYSMTQSPFPEGSHFICGFNHLSSYAANYYGYLWSKVYAQDIFSVFEKNGVLNQQVGIKYRKDILEKGATEEESAELRTFLGREPNSKAFLKSLGLK
jgi:Zn-dependent oligopeptidase